MASESRGPEALQLQLPVLPRAPIVVPGCCYDSLFSYAFCLVPRNSNYVSYYWGCRLRQLPSSGAAIRHDALLPIKTAYHSCNPGAVADVAKEARNFSANALGLLTRTCGHSPQCQIMPGECPSCVCWLICNGGEESATNM